MSQDPVQLEVADESAPAQLEAFQVWEQGLVSAHVVPESGPLHHVEPPAGK